VVIAGFLVLYAVPLDIFSFRRQNKIRLGLVKEEEVGMNKPLRTKRVAVWTLVFLFLLSSLSVSAYNPPEGDTSFQANYNAAWPITDGRYNAHGSVVLQAIEVLAGDERQQEVEFFRAYREQLLSGAREADEGGGIYDMIVTDVPRNSYSHFWNPDTNQGFRMSDAIVSPLIQAIGGALPLWEISSTLGPHVSAADMADWQYAKAVDAMRRADNWSRLANAEEVESFRQRAMRFLGYTLHLVADSTVPQHAADIGAQDKLFGNHEGYENLCDELIPLIHHAQSDGIYDVGRPSDYYHRGAQTSNSYADLARLPFDLFLSKEIIQHRKTLQQAIDGLKQEGIDTAFLPPGISEWIEQSDQVEDHFFPAHLIRLSEQLCAGLLDRFYQQWAQEEFRVVTLTLNHVQALPGEKWVGWPINEWIGWKPYDVDNPDWADFYAKVTIAGREFRRGVIEEGDDIWPNTASAFNWVYPCWLSSTATAVPVVISLWDQDGVTGDDHVDISPQGGRDLDFTYNPTSGEIAGDIAVKARSHLSISGLSRHEIQIPQFGTDATVEGDDRDTRARMQFDIESVPENAPRIPWEQANQWEGSWLKFIGSDSPEAVTSALPLSDGSFLLAGFIEVPQYHEYSLPEPGYDLTLLNVGTDGEIRWQKRVGGEKDWGDSLPAQGSYGIWDVWGSMRAEYYWVEIIPTRDHGFALVYDSFLIKFDAQFEVEWAQQYFHWETREAGYVLTSLLELPEGGYIVCGNYPQKIQSDPAFVARLDANGNVDWCQVYQGVLSTKHPTIRLALDGSLLLATRAQISDLHGAGYRTALLWLDLVDGSVQRVVSLEGAHIPAGGQPGFFFLHEVFQAFAVSSDGPIFLSHASVENVGTGAIVSKLNPEGGLLWSTRIHSPRHGGYTLVQALVPVEDGVYAIGEITEFGHKGYFHYHSFIARLDGAGSVIWIRTLGKPDKAASGNPGEELGLAGALLPDQGLLVAGTTNAFVTGYDILVARLGPNGAINGAGDWLIAPNIDDRKNVQISSPEMLYNSWQPETSPLPFFAQQFEMETVNGDLQVITP
jgi:hypothetical protein